MKNSNKLKFRQLNLNLYDILAVDLSVESDLIDNGCRINKDITISKFITIKLRKGTIVVV
jgi:hypothetical protein